MIEYDSAALRRPALQELGELWHYRHLLRLLVINSIKTRYKRSVLGVLWTLLNPLLNTLVLTIAFSQLFRFSVENYPIYLLSGLIFWNFFAQTTQQATTTLVWGSNLVKRIYIPRTIFAVSVLGNGLVNFVLALIPLLIIMLILGHPIHWTVVLLPVPVLLLTMFTLGVALLVSALAIFFADIVDLYSVLLSAWFYLTPIVYPADIIPEAIAPFLRFNPMSLLLEQFRSLVYLGQIPDPVSVLTATGVSLAVLLLGWFVFTQRVDELAYRI